MEIFIILTIIGIVLATIIFNTVNAVKKKITRIKIVNGILFGIIGLILIGQLADTTITNKDRFAYDINSRALLGSYTYNGYINGYYIINSSTFMGSGNSYAIPEKNVHIPLLTRFYSPVKLYSVKNTSPDDGKDIYINNEHYIVAENVVKIRPEYFDLFIITGIPDIFTIVIYNFVEFIFRLLKRRS